MTYATGRTMDISDRPEIDRIAAGLQKHGSRFWGPASDDYHRENLSHQVTELLRLKSGICPSI